MVDDVEQDDQPNNQAFNGTHDAAPPYTPDPGRLPAPAASSEPPAMRLMPERIAVSACKFRRL